MQHETTFLFTDIEGSTRLWEQQPDAMRQALALHDALCRDLVQQHRGRIVKTTGDGLHAAFDDPADALAAMVALQLALADPASTGGVALQVRCGAHFGPSELRGGDHYGPAVNRAARISAAAHGGQMLLSQALADAVAARLPQGVTLRELGPARLRDLAEPERLVQVLHPGLRQDFPALRSLEATPNNLAQQLNTFIDREDERLEMRALLQTHRLLTLLGVGGIGKSRLSVQLAAELMDDYPDGVWLVELAPLSDAQLVAQAVSGVLGVKESPGQSAVEALLAHVRERRMLILLDNCEHLLAACASIAKRLLQAGARLRIVATSREPLRVAGERLYPLAPLRVPEADTPADRLAGHTAVQLLVDRVSAVQPGFQVESGNAAAVAEICRRVDGIPLAIELAAARARALSVQAIAARLVDSFRLISTRDQTVLPRQRTLHALIDWSHNLLADDEKRLFRRLGVFAGGFTLELAEAVCSDEELPADAVLDVLTLLVEKSLAAFDAGRERYRLLETVRQYAQERLYESGEAAALRRRHLVELLALAEAARPQLEGPAQGEWARILEAEHQNLLTAHAASLSLAGCGALGLRLAHALRPYWFHRGLLGLGLSLTQQVLAAPENQANDLERCGGLFGAGQICFFMGRHDEAIRYLEECLSIARSHGDLSWVAGALQPLGMAYLGRGDEAAARAHLEEAQRLNLQAGDPREVAAASNALAQLHRRAGRLDEAHALYRQVVQMALALGDLEIEAVGRLNLAMVAIDRLAFDEARATLHDVLEIVGATGSLPIEQSVLDVCSGLAAELADWPNCARFHGLAQALAERTGLQRDAADEAFVAPRLARAREALGDADFERRVGEARALPEGPAAQAAGHWLTCS